MRTAAFVAAAALLRSCVAMPQSHETLVKRARDTISVTGVANGVVGVRREITELASDTDAYNLYLLAMKRFLASDTADVLSYYQLASVHGVPCEPFSGVQADQAALNQGGCGYCTHSSTLFPPWHRAYLAAYEQGFYEQVQGVIDDFAGNPSQQARFQAKADGLRIAYWDWAAVGSGKSVPSVLTSPQVTVPSPSGGSQSIANPFYSYTLQRFNEADIGGWPWNWWTDTVRCPQSDGGPTSVDAFVNNLQSAFTSVQALTYKMLTNCLRWDEISNDAAGTSSEGCSAGLESIHDQVHMNIGGRGHMGDLGHASFDPIFWLHHTNVDRLLALWQIVQDNKWYEAGLSGYATYTHTSNQWADGNYPLTPFYKDAGSGAFWTPNDMQDWTTLGYTYPETTAGPWTDKSSVVAIVNHIYGNQELPPVESGDPPVEEPPAEDPPAEDPPAEDPPAEDPPAEDPPAEDPPTEDPPTEDPPTEGGVSSSKPVSSRPTASKTRSSTPKYTSTRASATPSASASGGYLTPLPTDLDSLLTPIGRIFDWSVSIVAERMGLGGSFVVYVFFGDVPEDSSSWSSANNLVGTHGFLASSYMTASSGWLSSGSVSLTGALVKAIKDGKLKGLDSSVVEPFLHQKLNWAVKKATGEVVDPGQVPGLEITVVLTKLVPPKTEDKAPTYEIPESYKNVTSGSPGGWSGFEYTPGSYTPGSSSGSGSGYYGASPNYGSGSGSPSYGSCIPNVKYVYEYVYV